MKYKVNVIHKGVFYPAGTDVPVGAPEKVELVDNVPNGALGVNEDDSDNTYDEDENKVEAVAKTQEETGEAVEDQDKPKRGRKSKEA